MSNIWIFCHMVIASSEHTRVQASLRQVIAMKVRFNCCILGTCDNLDNAIIVFDINIRIIIES